MSLLDLPAQPLRIKRKGWLLLVLFFGSLVLLIRTAIVDWSWIPTGSMNPTIVEGDIVLNNKLAYDLRIPLTPWKVFRRNPERGEIAVFQSPENSTKLVKRVIGLPGDVISMKQGVLFLNGDPIDYRPLSREQFQEIPPRYLLHANFLEERLSEDSYSIMFVPGAPLILRNIPPITVPDGKYFMLGDNRDFSRDSRMYGFIDREKFLGRTSSVLISFRQHDRFQPRSGRFFLALR